MRLSRFGRLHVGCNLLAYQCRFQPCHDADDSRHGPPHGTAGIDLILNADEAEI